MNANANTETVMTAPELCLSLWSLRDHVASKPIETIELIKQWGISKVEVTGFCDLKPSELKGYLQDSKLAVCGLGAPPLKAGHEPSFYSNWANTYLPFFETDLLILQSSREGFSWKTRLDLIAKVAQEMADPTIRVCYHCYPYDFELFQGRSLISTLFSLNAVPGNFGLELDTFWLNFAGVGPDAYEGLPIHSVHLNERDAEGRCCLLGMDEAKCLKYIRPLATREPRINWILENNPDEKYAFEEITGMIQLMGECIEAWPKLWRRITGSVNTAEA